MRLASPVHDWRVIAVRQKAPQRTFWYCIYGCGARTETEGLPEGWVF